MKTAQRVTSQQRRRVYAAVGYYPGSDPTISDVGALPIRVVDGEECVVVTKTRPHHVERRYNYIGYAIRIEVGRGWLARSDAAANR